MKKTGTILLFLFLSSIAYSQERDTYQADSIMSMNHIKTKVRFPENTVSKAKEIYHFDKQGRLVEYILTDNYTEEKVQFNTSYIYSQSNQLIQEIDSSFSDSKPNIKITDYIYETNGSYSAITYRNNKKKKILSEIVFQADSNKEIHRFFNDKKEITRENISYYEKQNYTYKFAGSEKDGGQPKTFVINGKEFKIEAKNSWEYIFKNKYDVSGKLIERERIENGVVQDKSMYIYDSKGLLIEVVKMSIYNGKESKSKTLFKYTQWD